MVRNFMLSAAALVMFAVPQVEAATYSPPVGVQSDISITDVTSGGWTTVYSGTYNDYVPYDTVFDNLLDWVILASQEVGKTTFDLLAAIRVSDWNALATGRHVTEDHNGVAWYRNGGSLGFAPEGAEIFQYSADGAATGYSWGTPIDGTSDLRLSWHTTGGYNSAPTSISGGWRSGLYDGNGGNIYLNGSSWNRYVLTASDTDLGIGVSPVPVPASIVMLFAALSGLMLFRRRPV